jgi:mRNA-degrading endonuclease toxin of MazEF toxin-antitoxin module
MTLVMPITRTYRNTPMLIALDEGTITKGYVMIDQARSVDLSKREPEFIETVSREKMEEVLCTYQLTMELDNE